MFFTYCSALIAKVRQCDEDISNIAVKNLIASSFLARIQDLMSEDFLLYPLFYTNV